MVALFAVNYDGLRKRDSYDTLVDRLASGGFAVKEPDRRAKQLRETPQLANLLDGEGMGWVDLEKQQQNAARHALAEARIREEAGAPGAPAAQEMRAAATQTYRPKFVSVRSQASPDVSERFAQAGVKTSSTGTGPDRAFTASGGTQTDPPQTAPQIFDMAADDRVAQEAQAIDDIVMHMVEGDEKKRARLAALFEKVYDASPAESSQLARATHLAEKRAEASKPMDVEASATKTKAGDDPVARPKAQRRADRFDMLADSDAPPKVAEEAPAQTSQTHGVEKVEDKSRAWWARQNIAFIKTQAELRGRRFSDMETKGGKVVKDGKLKPQKKLSKEQYLQELYSLLGI